MTTRTESDERVIAALRERLLDLATRADENRRGADALRRGVARGLLPESALAAARRIEARAEGRTYEMAAVQRDLNERLRVAGRPT